MTPVPQEEAAEVVLGGIDVAAINPGLGGGVEEGPAAPVSILAGYPRAHGLLSHGAIRMEGERSRLEELDPVAIGRLEPSGHRGADESRHVRVAHEVLGRSPPAAWSVSGGAGASLESDDTGVVVRDYVDVGRASRGHGAGTLLAHADAMTVQAGEAADAGDAAPGRQGRAPQTSATLRVWPSQ